MPSGSVLCERPLPFDLVWGGTGGGRGFRVWGLIRV